MRYKYVLRCATDSPGSPDFNKFGTSLIPKVLKDSSFNNFFKRYEKNLLDSFDVFFIHWKASLNVSSFFKFLLLFQEPLEFEDNWSFLKSHSYISFISLNFNISLKVFCQFNSLNISPFSAKPFFFITPNQIVCYAFIAHIFPMKWKVSNFCSQSVFIFMATVSFLFVSCFVCAFLIVSLIVPKKHARLPRVF